MVECPKCKSNSWMVEVHQMVDCELKENFEIDDVGCDFSDPEVVKDTVECGACGLKVVDIP